MTYDNFTIWLAGFFDGEGCVYMQLDKRGNRRCYGLQVAVTQKDPETLYKIQERYGGKVLVKTSSGCHIWRAINRNASKFLEDIEPYLLIKRRQVQLAIEFIGTLREKNLGCVPIKEELSDRRALICKSIKELKIVGANVPASPEKVEVQ